MPTIIFTILATGCVILIGDVMLMLMLWVIVRNQRLALMLGFGFAVCGGLYVGAGFYLMLLSPETIVNRRVAHVTIPETPPPDQIASESFSSPTTSPPPAMPSIDPTGFQNLSGLTTPAATATPEPFPAFVTVIGVGDIMPGDAYQGKLPPDDGQTLFAGVKHIIQSADVAVGNLEGVFLDEGEPAKKCVDPANCYFFRIPERYVSLLTDAGFDALSLANNHINDFGKAGVARTVQLLTEHGVYFAGLPDHPFKLWQKDGVTYGFCAFAPNRGTWDVSDLETAQFLVRELAAVCDIVIVSVHAGAEGNDHQHVPRAVEYYLGEYRGDVYTFAHTVIDAGADVVFGHGPHVTRAFELYHDRFIAYSLGNFCTYGSFSLRKANGFAPIVKLTLRPDGEFLHGEVYPIKQIAPGGPQLDPDHQVISVLQALTAEDFPETALLIQDDRKLVKGLPGAQIARLKAEGR